MLGNRGKSQALLGNLSNLDGRPSPKDVGRKGGVCLPDNKLRAPDIPDFSLRTVLSALLARSSIGLFFCLS